MRKEFKNYLLTALGWVFVILGLAGVILPMLPSTPFFILALFLFSKSSPRFYRMLLSNQWSGPALKRWEESKSMARRDKLKALILIIFTFSASLWVLRDRVGLQIMLVCIGASLLFFIWQIKEKP